MPSQVFKFVQRGLKWQRDWLWSANEHGKFSNETEISLSGSSGLSWASHGKPYLLTFRVRLIRARLFVKFSPVTRGRLVTMRDINIKHFEILQKINKKIFLCLSTFKKIIIFLLNGIIIKDLYVIFIDIYVNLY